nr:hypothetical protein [Aeromonas lusitana]
MLLIKSDWVVFSLFRNVLTQKIFISDKFWRVMFSVKPGIGNSCLVGALGHDSARIARGCGYTRYTATGGGLCDFGGIPAIQDSVLNLSKLLLLLGRQGLNLEIHGGLGRWLGYIRDRRGRSEFHF